MYNFDGIHEGVLVLPTGRPVPLNIDCVSYGIGVRPDINVSIIGGSRGHYLLDEYERMIRGRSALYKPFVLPPTNPTIKNVIFNDPATIVIWSDDTKTVVKCQPGDTYDKELGLALCISKKYFGNKGNFNEVFKKWIPEDEKKETITAYDGDGNIVAEIIKEDISVEEMRKRLDRYCDDGGCNGCPLSGKEICRCGFGTHFLKIRNGSYDMSDDEIRDAYNRVFGK